MRARLLPVLFVSLILAGPAWPEPHQWTSTGPYGGQVRSLAISPADPLTLYAGTWGNGVFKSEDGGASWRAANSGLSKKRIEFVAVDPILPATVFAGTVAGVFKSSDGGATWDPVRITFYDDYVSAIAIDPTDPATVYVSMSGWWTWGVFKTMDGGSTWTEMNLGLYAGLVTSLAIDPNEPATVYAGAWGDAVLKSTNGGMNWVVMNPGPHGDYETVLMVDPFAPATLYKGTFEGVFKSTDGAKTWSPASVGMGDIWVSALVSDPLTPGTLYATTSHGLFKSTDAGANWSGLPVGQWEVSASTVAVDPANSETVYASTPGGGVFKSTDAGATWVLGTTGLADLSVRAVAFDPTSPTTIYAGSFGGGVFKSTDGARSWRAINDGLGSPDVRSLAIRPDVPTTVYAGTEKGVFKTIDGGTTWVGSGLTGQPISALAMVPDSPGTIYAGAFGAGVFKTTDGGGTWNPANSGIQEITVESLAIDPSAPETVYAGTSRGVYKTTDGGGWNAITSGMPETFVRSLAIDPSTPTTLYAGVQGSVYKTTDGGAIWNKTGFGLSYGHVYALAADPSAPATVYAGIAWGYDSDVFKTTNGGADWSPVNGGKTFAAVYALGIQPDAPSTLVAGTASGVFSLTQPTCPAPSGFDNNTAVDLAACTSSGVRVRWSDPADWGDGGSSPHTFDVLRSGEIIVKDLPATTHEVVDTSAKPNASYVYSVRATNACGAFSITPGVSVADASGPPPFSLQPLSQRVSAGSSVRLVVSAGNATSYQWYAGSSGDAAHPIADATSPDYTTPLLAATATYWVRASNSCGSTDSATATITVTASTAVFRYLVPVIAHWPGEDGTAWRSDVSVINPGTSTAVVTLLYYSATDSMEVVYRAEIARGGTTVWRDVLVSVLGLGPGASNKGTLHVTSDSPLVVFSRTYSQGSGGTFGQLMPALDVRDSFGQGEVGYLPHLTQNDTYRTHVGFANLSPDVSCSAVIRLHDPNGRQLGTPVTLTVGAGRTVQRDYIFAAAGLRWPQEFAYATVRISTADCVGWAYASVVDTATGDPTTVPVEVP